MKTSPKKAARKPAVSKRPARRAQNLKVTSPAVKSASVPALSEQLREAQARLATIAQLRGTVELSMDRRVLDANDNFLKPLGRSLEALRGQSLDTLMEPEYRSSAGYRTFWTELAEGINQAGQYAMLTESGQTVWFQANFNPVPGVDGRPTSVSVYTTDITADKLRIANYEGQLAAISKSQAVIEFTLDGVILDANENFLNALGYSLAEIKGQHHSMFVDAAVRQSPDYRLFWDKLGRGEYDAGQYKRIGKGGREIWIQASYNPILDMDGKPFKVVKYATDVTAQVRASQVLQQAVEQTQGVVAAAQDGDLTQRIELDGKDGSIRDLCGGVNALVENMALVVGRIKEASGAINVAAREIAAGNNDLSTRTEQQAASLEETASSMEELTSTVKQNAENARQANQLAIGASDVATKGGSVVSQVVTTMSSISDASKKIAEIISVIDGIAFQTNILALNAAVEAARAGEQGRGFAVVASEVRSLAQRSAGAAKEIKTLIGDSVERVGAGSKLVEQAGSTMTEIVTAVKRVTDIMAEISAASQEQSQGIEQVNTTITQMDEVTQQNAALVEEASASARALEEQADSLTASVSQFRIDDSHEMTAVTDRPAMAAARKPAVGTKPTPRPAARPAATATKRSPGNGSKPAVNGHRAPLAAGGADDQWTEF